MLTVSELLDLRHTLAGAYLGTFRFPWEALEGIRDLILSLQETLGEDYVSPAPQVFVHGRMAIQLE